MSKKGQPSAHKGKSKKTLIEEFNKTIDDKIAGGIPQENLPSKIGEREGKNMNINEARSLVSTLNKGDFTNTIYASEKNGTALTTGMQEVDRIRIKAYNRYQRERLEKIKTLPTYQEAQEYEKRSLEHRADVVELTEGGDALPERLKAKRIRSHEQFYETSGGENLKKMLVSAIENQGSLIDLTDYISWIKGIDAEVIEDVYYSDVDFDVKEFYLSQYSDDFMSMLNTFKGKIQSVAMRNQEGSSVQAENKQDSNRGENKFSTRGRGTASVKAKASSISIPKTNKQKRYSQKQMKSIMNEGAFYTKSLKSGEVIGLAYKTKMNKSWTGFDFINGKKTKIYYGDI